MKSSNPVQDEIIDVFVVGGGINGCGCAADAAIRGLKVMLCEKGDIGSQTSSNSSKLIHGGIRYLEHYEFALVRKALIERQKLMHIAPHLIEPLALCLPHQAMMRPSWLIRSGLFLYDNLTQKNTLPKSQRITRKHNTPYLSPLLDSINHGYLYYDCVTDDARLTLANALQATNYGAKIFTHTELVDANFANGLWQVSLRAEDGTTFMVKARALINAAGNFVSHINKACGIPNRHELSFVKGSHIVVPKLYEGEHAYLLQHRDKRVIFTVPYHGKTMVGTTDVPLTSSSEAFGISPQEQTYLIDLLGLYFKKAPSQNHILSSWSGLRTLLHESDKDASQLSRDCLFELSNEPGPAVTIYSGKITTYRTLAENTINALSVVFPKLPPSQTHLIPLPGAKLQDMPFHEFHQHAQEHYAWLNSEILARYLKTYGTRTATLLDGCSKHGDLGAHIGEGLFQKEIDFLVEHEWAKSAEDILWRRTKLGLKFTAHDIERLQKALN